MIGIICALSSEIEEFKKALVLKEETKILKYVFYQGTINQHECVIVQCGIGKVQAGVCTSLMIEHFNPSLVINSGIAGGFDKKLKTLDAVFAATVACYDIDMTIDGKLFGCFENEKRFLKTKIACPKECISGFLMTADKFAGNRQELEMIFDKYFKDIEVTCVDMESYAICSILDDNHIDWIVLRTISDLVGESEQIKSYYNFPELASKKSFDIIMNNFLN